MLLPDFQSVELFRCKWLRAGNNWRCLLIWSWKHDCSIRTNHNHWRNCGSRFECECRFNISYSRFIVEKSISEVLHTFECFSCMSDCAVPWHANQQHNRNISYRHSQQLRCISTHESNAGKEREKERKMGLNVNSFCEYTIRVHVFNVCFVSFTLIFQALCALLHFIFAYIYIGRACI